MPRKDYGRCEIFKSKENSWKLRVACVRKTCFGYTTVGEKEIIEVCGEWTSSYHIWCDSCNERIWLSPTDIEKMNELNHSTCILS